MVYKLTEPESDLAILSTLVADLHNERGGSSVSITDSSTPYRGYMVSLHGFEYHSPYQFITGFDVREYIQAAVPNAKRMNAGQLYVGTWFDPHKQLSFFDLSINVMDKGTALQIARENKQTAIYDVKNERTIAVA